MSKSQHRLELAILRDQFGDSVASVLETLHLGERRVPKIASLSKLPISLVRESLSVLLHHDMVRARTDEVDPGPMTSYRYSIQHERILFRMRIPQILKETAECFGEEAEAIVFNVSLHGRVRLANLIGYVCGGNPGFEEEALWNAIDRLEESQLLVRRQTSRSGLVQELNIVDSDSDEEPYAYTPNGNGKRQRTKHDASAAQKKKSKKTENASYYVVNYNQYFRRMRNNWIVAFIEDQFDENAANIVKAMLNHDILRINKEELGTPLLPDIIASKLDIEAGQVKEYLSLLARNSDGIIVSSNPYFRVNFAIIPNLAKRLFIEKVVTYQYGLSAARLLRMIIEYNHLEQKQVKEIALIGTYKETKSILNRMFRGQILTLREVPRQGTRDPSNCLYLWTCDIAAVSRMLLERAYKTQANLMSRRVAMQDEYSRLELKLGRLPEELEEQADIARANLYKDEMKQLQEKLDQLDAGFEEVELQVAMFRDFDDN
eukprot:m.105628 g.105628  ORF g.105628 m.105628 type:complete len:489 (-) comp13884_c0_seq4:3053-4519(-)